MRKTGVLNLAELKDTAPGQDESSREIDGKEVTAHPAKSQNIVKSSANGAAQILLT